MIVRVRSFVLFAFVLLLVPGFLFARAQSDRSTLPLADEIIPDDPDVRFGVLENGLSYYVRANDSPSSKAELRLIVKAGSVLEDEDQLGLAHFLEHMLFNGTERFPDNELVETLESFGIEFGPEINAYTTFEQTVYRLSVRTDDEEQFLTGLDVLEDWAFNATLDEEAYEKERQVIHEEWRVGRDAQARMLEQTYPVLFYGSRYAERRPIGDMDVVLNAPVEKLRSFYEDWYRPDLMAVIAVGDFDADETVARIVERFGHHDNPGNPPPRPEFEVPNHDETLVSIVSDDEAVRSSVQLYVKYRPDPPVYRNDLSKDLAEQLFYIMLNQRLGEISRGANPPFLYGYSFANPYSRSISLTGLAAAVGEDSVLSGMEALVAEAERVQRHGFSEAELERAKTDVLSYFESYWKQRNDLESRDLVNNYVDAFLLGDRYPSIDWQWDAVQDLVPAITLNDVNRVALRLLGDSNRVVIINGPSVPGVNNLEDSDVLAVLNRLEMQSLDPWKDVADLGPLVENPPEGGSVVRESVIPGTGILDWKLSNGARILLKPTDFRRDEVLFRAISPGGASLVDDEDYISAQFATDAVSQGGLGRFSADSLRKALTGKNVDLNAFIHETYEGFSGSASTEDVETLLQLVYLNQTAPRRDDVAWNALMGRMRESLKNRDSSPFTLYGDLLWATLYDNHFRARPVTVDRLDEAELGDSLDIFSRRFEGAGDFTYIFVGDFEPDEFRPLVAKWLGGLPAGPEHEQWIDRGMKNTDGVHTVSLEAGKEPLSVVTQVWYGNWDGSFTSRYHLQSLASALEMKLTKVIREEFGGTYSISVTPHLNVNPRTDYRFLVQYSCDPARVDELTSRVDTVIRSWQNAAPEQRFASDVAASQRTSLSENLERNDWWLGQIAFAVATDTEPTDLMNRKRLYNSLSPDLLSESARRYLKEDSYVEAILYPDPLALKAAGNDGSDQSSTGGSPPDGESSR